MGWTETAAIRWRTRLAVSITPRVSISRGPLSTSGSRMGRSARRSSGTRFSSCARRRSEERHSATIETQACRTPISFHDVYIAAPCGKATLNSWGSKHNLFASGATERVNHRDARAAGELGPDHPPRTRTDTCPNICSRRQGQAAWRDKVGFCVGARRERISGGDRRFQSVQFLGG